ncbi:hypothetical protein [Microbulbifer sp. ALW1]|uniref:hypothetical protein n=1 Tax=Microbulbifer sp. (strain ALW1) TaxID=1516059 RepID=UPI001357C482|nr:hypothetical protein [Microbulbifer sp. ALW1]
MRVFNVTGDCSEVSKVFPKVDEVSRWLSEWLDLDARFTAEFLVITPADLGGWSSWYADDGIVLVSNSIREFVDLELRKLSETCVGYDSESVYSIAENMLLNCFGVESIERIDVLREAITSFDVLVFSFNLPNGQIGSIAFSAACAFGPLKLGKLDPSPIECFALKNKVDLEVKKKVDINLQSVKSIRPGDEITLGALENFSWSLTVQSEDVGLSAYLGRNGDKRAVVVEN